VLLKKSVPVFTFKQGSIEVGLSNAPHNPPLLRLEGVVYLVLGIKLANKVKLLK